MRTAICIDDGLLRQADETARLMGLSRSKPFANALSDLLRRQRKEQMLARLNEVDATSGIDSREKDVLNGITSRVRRTVKERW